MRAMYSFSFLFCCVTPFDVSFVHKSKPFISFLQDFTEKTVTFAMKFYFCT